MRDATVRVLTSLAAALLGYAAVTAFVSLPLWARLAVAIVVAVLAWLVAGRIGTASNAKRKRVASGVRGAAVNIEGVTTRGSDINEVASDIDSPGAVVIKDVKHEDV